MSLASLDAVELLFYWGILDVFWGYGVFLRKIYLEILEFLQAKILKLEFLENYARNSSFTMLKTLKRQIGLAFFYIKNLAHSLKTFVNSSI